MGLFDIFSDDDANDAAAAQTAAITTGIGQAGDAYGRAKDYINQGTAQAASPLQTLFQTGGAGTAQLGNLLGLNGQAGNDQAMAALKATPGYQFALDQGSQNVLRNQASTGMLASGNTDKALTDYGEGLASQTYQSAVSNLSPYMNLYGTSGGALSGLFSGQGSQLANNAQSFGNLQLGAQSSIGNAQAQADLAKLSASSNLWGALGGILGGGAKLAGALS